MKNQHGFTFVELLVIMVIIGILAAIALPKFTGARDKAYVSSMAADLRSLSSSQEIHHTDHQEYSDDLTELGARVSEGVTIAIQEANSTSWSALATHAGTSRTCAIYYGEDVAAILPAIERNVVACDPP